MIKGFEIMRDLDHPHIVRMYDMFIEGDVLQLVMEYMPGGALSFLLAEKTTYTEDEARPLVRVLVEAIKYCHDKGIVHRDICPDNLFATSSSSGHSLKLGSFHFASRLGPSGFLSTFIGRPSYIAPEIINSMQYTKSVDMWSMGVLLYEMLGGYPPFADDNDRRLLGKITRGHFEFHTRYWSEVGVEARQLVRGLLVTDPDKRLTPEEVLVHPWVSIPSSV